jgi:hypothetical protein
MRVIVVGSGPVGTAVPPENDDELSCRDSNLRVLSSRPPRPLRPLVSWAV